MRKTRDLVRHRDISEIYSRLPELRFKPSEKHTIMVEIMKEVTEPHA